MRVRPREHGTARSSSSPIIIARLDWTWSQASGSARRRLLPAAARQIVVSPIVVSLSINTEEPEDVAAEDLMAGIASAATADDVDVVAGSSLSQQATTRARASGTLERRAPSWRGGVGYGPAHVVDKQKKYRASTMLYCAARTETRG